MQRRGRSRTAHWHPHRAPTPRSGNPPASNARRVDAACKCHPFPTAPRHANATAMIANWLRREPGFFYDFLGVRTRVSYLLLPEWADGHIFGIPHPGERFLHSRAEWFGLLRAVDEASDRLVAAELGAGWGPWLVAAHAAARQKGIGEVHLIGVESSVDHAEMMRQHFVDNGIDPKA